MAKTKRRIKSLLENVGVLSPVIVSLSGFVAIAAFWDGIAEWFGLGKLGVIERLAFGAAMSWVMFLLTDLVKEVIGMLTLTSRRENWREEIAAEERAKASAIAAEERAKASAIAAEERAKERAATMEFLASERAKDREIILANQETIRENQKTIRENQETIRVLLQHLTDERERKTDD